MDGFQDRTEDEITEDELSSGADIGIDSAYENDEDNIEMVIRNTGRYSIAHENWELFVDGRQSSNLVDFDSEIPGEGLDPQQTETIETDVEFPGSGEEKVVEIIGEHVETSVVCLGGSDRC